MRHNKLSLFLHLNWTTWDRLPLIEESFENRLHHQLHDEANRHGCKLLAVGGIADHVHLLLELPATLAVADLVRQLKGVSSHFVNETIGPETPFKWQASYGAFTVSRWDVRKIAHYIRQQKEHHAAGTTIESLERSFQIASD